MIERIDKELIFHAPMESILLGGQQTGSIRLGRRIPEIENLPIVIKEGWRTIGIADIDTLVWLKFGSIKAYPEILNRVNENDLDQLLESHKPFYPNLAFESWITFYGFRLQKAKSEG